MRLKKHTKKGGTVQKKKCSPIQMQPGWHSATRESWQACLPLLQNNDQKTNNYIRIQQRIEVHPWGLLLDTNAIVVDGIATLRHRAQIGEPKNFWKHCFCTPSEPCATVAIWNETRCLPLVRVSASDVKQPLAVRLPSRGALNPSVRRCLFAFSVLSCAADASASRPPNLCFVVF